MTPARTPTPLAPLSPDGLARLLDGLKTSARNASALGEAMQALWLHCCLVAGVKPHDAESSDRHHFRAVSKAFSVVLNRHRIPSTVQGLIKVEDVAKAATKAYFAALEARAVKQGGVQQGLTLGEVS